MAYNFTKNDCDKCGITKAQRAKMPPMLTGINHPVYYQTTSFSLAFDGSVLCPECNKEKQLASIFNQMDAFEEKHGKAALQKRLGLNTKRKS